MALKYIAALDIGTTSIRCHIFNSNSEVVGAANQQVILIYSKPQYVEIDPNELWNRVILVINEAIKSAKLHKSDIKCLGISTPRSTFLTWKKSDGKPLHNFITWKDLRASELVKEWNSSLLMKSFRAATYCLYLLSGSKRYLTASRLMFANSHTTLRLLWTVKNIPELKEELQKKNVLFGTVDTWLIHKLTGRKLHVTDITSASGTGLFDPFLNEWGVWAVHMMKLPHEIFPEVVPNDFDFGETDPDIFGVSIPIKCSMSDQSASMFGSCCFSPNDLKVTLGTGCFLSVNTGDKIHTSTSGLYPVVAWDIKGQVVYMAETSCNDAGSLIEWAIKAGFVQNPSETMAVLSEVQGNDGVYFVPAFSGLGPPINNEHAATGFIGVKPTTTKGHMMRAILESIVFRIVLSYNLLKEERSNNFKKICIDGGVSKNDFVCQLLADMTGLEVERATSSEITVLGVAFVSGLNSGVWKNLEDLKKLRKIDCSFKPATDKKCADKYKNELNVWLKAVERFKSWY